jgi:hypothetical protein
MRLRINRTRPSGECGATAFCKPLRRRWGRVLCLSVLACLASIVALGQQTPSPSPEKQQVAPGANQQVETRDARVEKPSSGDKNGELNKQIAEDSAHLLKLANDLRTEVDKAALDNLSLKVIRDADAIEKLAHNLRKKMAAAGGPAS